MMGVWLLMDNLYGKYRAQVIDIDDPDELGRIRVLCPKVMGQLPLEWAMSCFPPGIFDIPERGDSVWIEFENGDVDKPIWTGIFATKSYMKRFLPYDPAKRLWKTKKSSLEMNDTSQNVLIDAAKDFRITAAEHIKETAGHTIDRSASHLVDHGEELVEDSL